MAAGSGGDRNWTSLVLYSNNKIDKYNPEPPLIEYRSLPKP